MKGRTRVAFVVKEDGDVDELLLGVGGDDQVQGHVDAGVVVLPGGCCGWMVWVGGCVE